MKHLMFAILLAATSGEALAREQVGPSSSAIDVEARIAAKRSGSAPVRFIRDSTVSVSDLARFYPERAYRAGISGAATVVCVVTAQGRLGDCKIASETPVGAGFGDATMRVAKIIKVKSTDRDGDPVEGVPFVLPLNWAMPR